MSLETEIGQLTKAINELNAKFELLFNSQKTTPTPPPTQAQEVPTTEQPALIPAIAKDVFTREELQTLCLDVIRRNEANRAIVKAIMLQHFDARKTSDLADNQIGLCYNLIKEATHDA